MSIKFPINMYDPTRDYNTHKIEYDNAISNILNSGMFIGGTEIGLLEKQLAKYIGVKHCITVANGTDAIQIALMALNVSVGDEVITVSHTWISSAEVISIINAVPVFIDVESDYFHIDVNKIENAITNKTKAIVAVSLYGQVVDIDVINEIANKYNIPVIEDAAQSFGAKYKDGMSCGLSTIGTTSFFPSKPMGCYGDGGACFTDNDELALKIRSIKNHGCMERFKHDYIGMNSRLDTLQASVLLVKMKYLDDNLLKRNYVANYYNDKLKNLEDMNLIQLPKIRDNCTHVWAQYSILMRNIKERDYVFDELKKHKINVAIFYPKSLHIQRCFQNLGYQEQDFPVTINVSNTIINLPCYSELEDSELEYITNTFIKISLKILENN